MTWDKWMVLVVGVGWSWIGGRILKLRTFLMKDKSTKVKISKKEMKKIAAIELYKIIIT